MKNKDVFYVGENVEIASLDTFSIRAKG
ncbi:hypothetical protein LCGC14_2307540, partial [marine sediment metagenome]